MKKSRLKFLFILITFQFIAFGCKQNVDKETDSKKEKAINGFAKNDSTLYSVQDAMKLHGLKGLSTAVLRTIRFCGQELGE